MARPNGSFTLTCGCMTKQPQAPEVGHGPLDFPTVPSISSSILCDFHYVLDGILLHF